MAVKHGILGLLKKEDSHAYDLQSKFDQAAGNYWPVKRQQFYTTLERLEEQGYVNKQRVEQEKRPDRNVYSLTKDGQQEFQEWLTTPTRKPRTLKDEFFLKATFALDESPEVARKLLANQRKALLMLLHQLNIVLTDAKAKKDKMLALITKGAILHCEADLKWLEEFEATIERGDK